MADIEQLSYLLKYDTNHTMYRPNEVSFNENEIMVKGRCIKVYSEMEPSNLLYGKLGVDLVFECI